MARKKAAVANSGNMNFSGIHKVWEAISFDDWLMLLAEAKPESQFRRKSGMQILGSCPFHEGDRAASFYVTPGKGIVKCFGGTCNKVYTNPVRFVAAILGVNYGDALLYLRKRFGLRGILPEALIEHYQQYYVHQQHKRALVNAMRKLLVEAVAEPDNPIHMYAKPLVDWLIGTRGIAVSSVPNLEIGVVPPILYLEKELGGPDSPDSKWAREYLSSVYDGTNWLGALCFFMYDEPDNVARLKLRKPASKDIRWIDDRYDESNGKFRGFCGLNFYRDFFEPDVSDRVQPVAAKSIYIVEGEFDALSPIDAQIQSGNIDAIWIATGGKGMQLDSMIAGLGGLACLEALGIENIYLLGDKDDGGRGFVQQALKQTASGKLAVRIMTWPEFEGEEHVDEERRIKDPDEWIRSRGYTDFSRYARNIDNYQLPHQWTFDNAADEMESIAIDDVKQLSNVAEEWGKNLKNAAECGKFCELVAQRFGLDSAILNREINARDEDEDGFINRIIGVMEDHFHFVGIESVEGHKRRLELWHKASRTTVYVIVNDGKSIETALASFFGTLPDFVRDYLGDPSWTALEGEQSKLKIKQRTEMYRDYVNLAVLKRSKGLPDLRSATRKAQGLHHVGQNDRDGHLAYMVNGRDVYRISYPGDKMVVSALDGPTDGNVVFRVDPSATWLHSVHKAEHIMAGVAVDLPKLYDDVKRIVSTGWAFKLPLDPLLVATYIMCLPVMPVFPRQTAVMFTAEASAGKSKLTGGLIGGTEFPSINIVAHAMSVSQYSAASIRQSMDNCSLTLCLDEFEDYGDNSQKSLKVRAVIELLRDMLSEGGVKAMIGTTSGQPRIFHLRFPVVTCAIRPLRDEASLSRFISIEMARDVARHDPANVLMDNFGEVKIRQVKRDLAVGLYPHIPALHRIYGEISAEFATGVDLPARTPSRFREALYPVLSMMKLLGQDYKRFAYDFCDARKDQLARITSTSENEQIFETVLSSPFHIQQGEERVSGKTTIRAMLAHLERDAVEEINKTKCGVYFDFDTGWLVVHWIEALQGVLANSVKFGRETSPSYLKEMSQRSPHHVPVDQVRAQKVLERLKGWMGPGVQLGQVSVFDVRYLVEDARNTLMPAVTTPPKKDEKKTEAKKAPEGIPDPSEEGEVQGDEDLKV